MRSENIDPALSALIEGYGDRLAAAIRALGYKQAEFARLLGIGADRLNHWVKSKHPPSAHYLALMRRHGITPDWIVCGDYTSLPTRTLQGLITQGAAPDAPAFLRELRHALPFSAVPHPAEPPHMAEPSPAPPLPPQKPAPRPAPAAPKRPKAGYLHEPGPPPLHPPARPRDTGD